MRLQSSPHYTTSHALCSSPSSWQPWELPLLSALARVAPPASSLSLLGHFQTTFKSHGQGPILLEALRTGLPSQALSVCKILTVFGSCLRRVLHHIAFMSLSSPVSPRLHCGPCCPLPCLSLLQRQPSRQYVRASRFPLPGSSWASNHSSACEQVKGRHHHVLEPRGLPRPSSAHPAGRTWLSLLFVILSTACYPSCLFLRVNFIEAFFFFSFYI